jgi:hypothetical protein
LVEKNSIEWYRQVVASGMEYNINLRSVVAPGLMPP